MAVRDYKVTVVIGDRIVEIRENVETNYRGGEIKHLANLFYRAMLAGGYSPAATCEALSGVAQAGGHMLNQEQGDLFDSPVGQEEGVHEE